MMKRIALSLILSLALIGLGRAETLIVDFEEFASLIGNNYSWNGTNRAHSGTFPADFGTINYVESAYGGTVPELAYESNGVTFYIQGGISMDMSYWTGTGISTVTDTVYDSFYNEMASWTGTGNNGSQTYAVVYGDSQIGLSPDSAFLPHISLPTDAVLKSIAVTNTVYTLYTLLNDDPNGFAQPLTSSDGSFFDLLIYGLDENGDHIGTVTQSLGSYKGGILEYLGDWTTVDLSSLVGATELRFSFDGNDAGYGLWFNQPVYFAFDDLTYTIGGEDAAPTPEPATLLIFGLGLAGLILRRRK